MKDLTQGGGVVTTRAQANNVLVVTEWGVADLHGNTMAERAKKLIEIAHPGDREELDRHARQKFGSSWKEWH